MTTGGPSETDFAMAELARKKAQEECSRKTACWSDVHFLTERVEELERQVLELQAKLKDSPLAIDEYGNAVFKVREENQ